MDGAARMSYLFSTILIMLEWFRRKQKFMIFVVVFFWEGRTKTGQEIFTPVNKLCRSIE